MQCVIRVSRTLVSRSTIARVTLSRPLPYLSYNHTAWKHAEAAPQTKITSPEAAVGVQAAAKEETVTKLTDSESISGLSETVSNAATTTKPNTIVAEFKWDDIVEEVVEKVEITSAVLPWSELNFLQKLFFPYTYPVMHYLDFLSCHLPWWVAIVGTAATMKVLFFPLLVKLQKIGVRTHNIQPEIQKIQVDMNHALLTGDTYQRALNGAKMQALLKQHDVTIGQRLIPSLIQAPSFMTFFFLIRTLTESLPELHTAGILWFQDLSAPDPLMVLPFCTSLSMLLLIELGLGTESSPTTPVQSMKPLARWLFRLIPVGFFFMIFKFPAATLLFWFSNNFISLVFALLFKVPAIRTALRIPVKLKHEPAALPLTNQSLGTQLTSAKEMSRRSKSSLDLRRLDDLAFKKAGVGPLKKTYDKPPPQ